MTTSRGGLLVKTLAQMRLTRMNTTTRCLVLRRATEGTIAGVAEIMCSNHTRGILSFCSVH